MAEAIAQILLIGGSQLAYRVGRLLIVIMTLGNLSIEPLPKNFAAHFTQAFDDKDVTRDEAHLNYAVSYAQALTIGYVIMLTGFGIVLFVFRDYFINSRFA